MEPKLSDSENPRELVSRANEFDDVANLGRNGLGKRDMVCVGGRAVQSPAGLGVVFAGDGGMEMAAAACPAFRSGFGLDLWLRVDELT